MCIAKVALEFVLELLGVPKRSIPLKCLSRMMGNYHVRFLGELGRETARAYPTSYARNNDKSVEKSSVAWRAENLLDKERRI